MKKHLLIGVITASLLACASNHAAVSNWKTYQWTVWFADSGTLYKNVFNASNKRLSASQKPFIVSGKSVDWQGKQWNAQGTKNAIFQIYGSSFFASGMPSGEIAIPIPTTADYPIKSLIVFDHYAYVFALRKLYVVDINAPAEPIKRTIILPTNTIVFPQKPDSKYVYNRPSDRENDPFSTTVWIQPKGSGSKEAVDILDFDEMIYNPTAANVTQTKQIYDTSSGTVELKTVTKTVAPKTLELQLMGTTVIKFDISNPLKPKQID